MNFARSALLLGFGLLSVTILPVRDARAAWPHNPAVNVRLSTAAGNQLVPVSASDGAGGVIVAWQDLRGSYYDIYAQRISATGAIQWAAAGVPICTASMEQYYPTIAPDGAGGAIIAWRDNRAGNYDIYVQRISAAGAVQWAANGVALCTATGSQNGPEIAPDGTGGALVFWDDSRSGSGRPYGQRISAAGVVQWAANGLNFCTAGTNPALTQVVADGEGGAIIAWEDDRAGNEDLYAQRVSAAGAARWTANGEVVNSAGTSLWHQGMIGDGSGGAILAWRDNRSGTSDDIHAQRISGAGDVQWVADGVTLCAAAENQTGAVLVADDMGGAIVAWYDYRAGAYDVYAQRVSGEGVVQWTTNGVALCTVTGHQYPVQIVADGSGGAIAAWSDQRGAHSDVYAQRISEAGVAQWTAGGIPVCTAGASQASVSLVTDGAGGAIAVWSDERDGIADHVYAQRLEHYGYLGSPEAEITAMADIPGDEGGQVKLSWNASYLDTEADANLDYYDVLRSVPPNVARRALADGARVVATPIALDKGGAPSYFVTGSGDKSYYWELLGSVAAIHYLSGYSYVVPTPCDSTAAGNPATAAMVVARDSGRTRYWLSAPATGYSVDNLAPGMPVYLASRHADDATRIRWRPNTEADLFGYRLYRGASAGFVPGPANLVAAQADTGYVDAGASPFSWYKLTAVDAHGNESPVAALAPQQVAGVDDGRVPAVTGLLGAAPNPFNPATAITFSLARAGRVRLAVYDAAGRHVRTLVDESRAAGRHEVRWDGTMASGGPAASGIYYCHLESESVSETRSVTLVK